MCEWGTLIKESCSSRFIINYLKGLLFIRSDQGRPNPHRSLGSMSIHILFVVVVPLIGLLFEELCFAWACFSVLILFALSFLACTFAAYISPVIFLRPPTNSFSLPTLTGLIFLSKYLSQSSFALPTRPSACTRLLSDGRLSAISKSAPVGHL